MAAQAQSFDTPDVHFNAGGWGPTEDDLPTQFLDVPYAPFGKGDRLGRAADLRQVPTTSKNKNTGENGTPEIGTATSRTRLFNSSTTPRRTPPLDW